MTDIAIHSEFIKLDAFLKLSGACHTGGQAKIFILDGNVQVNGEVCLQRGKKLYPDDKVLFEGIEYKVVKL